MPETISKAALARLGREIDRPVPPDEARQHIDAPISDQERDRVWELVRWFTRRYPTPLAVCSTCAAPTRGGSPAAG